MKRRKIYGIILKWAMVIACMVGFIFIAGEPGENLMGKEFVVAKLMTFVIGFGIWGGAWLLTKTVKTVGCYRLYKTKQAFRAGDSEAYRAARRKLRRFNAFVDGFGWEWME